MISSSAGASGCVDRVGRPGRPQGEVRQPCRMTIVVDQVHQSFSELRVERADGLTNADVGVVEHAEGGECGYAERKHCRVHDLRQNLSMDVICHDAF